MPLYHVTLPVFEGPLDLLLRLIEREELDVTTVALARVTDQYLQHLADLERHHARDLADFLAVAAKLVLIKSAALLPGSSRPGPEDQVQDVGQDLVRQLEIYRRFKEVARLLHQREQQRLHSYVRLAPSRRLHPQPDLDGVTVQDLLSLAQQAFDALPAPPVGEVVSPITVTIADQIDHIQRQLSRQGHVVFRTLLSRAASRTEVIVTLLAVLELIKRDRVSVQQEALFGDIVIRSPATPSDRPDPRTANPAA